MRRGRPGNRAALLLCPGPLSGPFRAVPGPAHGIPGAAEREAWASPGQPRPAGGPFRMDTPTLPAPDAHRPDLDWLRVMAIVLLHLFHTGMMFNTWEWHVKSPQALPALEPTMEVLHLVRMPLLM